MNTAVNVNVVHESETQRQHARVRIPAKIRFAGKSHKVVEQQLQELSAGGFSYAAGKHPVQVGDYHQGELLFAIDHLGLTMPMEFQVRSVDFASGRVGCQFHNLKPRDIVTLRHLITAHLSGELVSVGELLSTLQRDNFSKPRKDKSQAGLGVFGRLRAMILSLAVLVIGVAAFVFIGKSLYELYFVTHAKAALVSVPGLQVTMPREGTVQSLIGADGLVDKGAPIGTFSASMLEMLKGHLNDSDLKPAKIEELFGKQMKGTLTSPCDCTLVRQLVADGQYASRGEVIFQLAPRGSQASIEASFPYTKLNAIGPGTRVSFVVAGEQEAHSGTIVSSNLPPSNNNDLSTDIRVQIQPDQPLDNALAGRPVEVSVNRGPSLAWLSN
ncbi:alginate biosynthesis protein Alg44 [Pseudomonas cavernae]|uniref:Alginate biosynthesis protein Alg44 n=1 Tax=Pseudomonas cavernae TaxID=2320867 RepID=A0A385YYN0_9PSED|nr:PilZ domain-containing protein [Pseudomonas cavernae]AYC31876.1 alginate biosynthesis protein Alg44 [Pseudomonas cavernae]